MYDVSFGKRYAHYLTSIATSAQERHLL